MILYMRFYIVDICRMMTACESEIQTAARDFIFLILFVVYVYLTLNN